MKQELIDRFEKEYPDVPVYTELESTELHRDFINWLISTVIADLNRQLEGFKSQYNTDAEAKDIAVNLLVEFQKWENKVAMDTPMQLETDEEDIALMFLEMGEIGSDALGNQTP